MEQQPKQSPTDLILNRVMNDWGIAVKVNEVGDKRSWEYVTESEPMMKVSRPETVFANDQQL
jgi:hypothetical protein